MITNLGIFFLYLIFSTGLLLTTTGGNLEYEYATLLSFLVVFSVPVITGNAPVNILGHFYKKISSLKQIIFQMIIPAFLGIWAPGIISFLSQSCPCGPEEFAFWTALQTTPAILLSLGLSFLLLQLRIRGLGRLPINCLWVIFVVIITIEIGATLWFMPQKRVTHWFTGFIHGPIYDSWITLDLGIIFLRISHGIMGLLLIIAGSKIRQIKLVKISGIFLTLIWFCLHLSSKGYPGTGHGHQNLQSILPRAVEGPGFTMHLPDPKSSKSSLTKYEKILTLQAEFHISELRKIFGQEHPPHVQIYVYPDESTKKLWFGADTTDVADVYSPSIHITRDAFPHPTLRHELVHALSSEFAWHGLGFHPNMALTEGLAVAFAPEFRTLSQDEGAASLIKKGRVGSIQRLFSPFFWLESGSRAYTIAGSFSSYILKQYGPEPLKHLYGGYSTDASFEKPFEAVVAQWKEYVLSQYDEEKYGLLAESLYRSPGLLFARCPHTKALYRRKAHDPLTTLRQPAQWDPDKNYRNWLINLHKNEKWVSVSEFRRKAKKTVQSSDNDNSSVKEDIPTLIEAIQSFGSWPPKDIEDLELKLLISDLTAFKNPQQEDHNLKELMEFLQEKHPGSGFIRQIHSRNQINKVPPELKPQQWRGYLAGWNTIPDFNFHENTSPWILKYLYDRNSGSLPESLKGSSNLRARFDEIPEEPDFPPDFAEQWLYKIGLTAAKQGYWNIAAEAFSKSASSAPTGKKERYIESARLASFIEKFEKIQ